MLYLGSFELAMFVLIFLIGTCIFSFARTYLEGDHNKGHFSSRFVLLLVCASATVLADHVGLLFFFWCMGNLLLAHMIAHKSQWQAARASGRVALLHFGLGAVFVGAALMMLVQQTGTTSIKQINSSGHQGGAEQVALSLMLLGAMVQSALWPFHRWLISSVNAPTPVSAVMHAGLVNGGGVLLIKFARLYLDDPFLLQVLFCLGLISATLGIFWKLIQPNVKGMLACSTMGQMGFMFAQCGLGLFPAAAAHLIWHGLFKAYLFLGSGSSAQERRYKQKLHTTPPVFLLSMLMGFWGSLVFGAVTDKSWTAQDTSLFLLALSFITTVQFSNTLLVRVSLKQTVGCFVATTIYSAFYGANVAFICNFLKGLHIWQPQPFSWVHFFGLCVFGACWLAPHFIHHFGSKGRLDALMHKIYVAALNGSQPVASTVTFNRNTYKFQ